MVIRTSRRSTRLGRLARLALLVPLSDLLAHDAIMQAGGIGQPAAHGYWPFFGLIVGVLALTLLASGTRRILGLRARLAGRGSAGTPDGDPGYHHELLRVWLALFPLTALFFLFQENLERFLSGGGVAGLAPLDPVQHPFALLLLALASMSVALVGALVRWRVLVLEHRLARLTQRGPRLRHRTADRPESAWGLIAAICRHRWMLLRLDPGRAPPAG